jgi:hypothetical protein
MKMRLSSADETADDAAVRGTCSLSASFRFLRQFHILINIVFNLFINLSSFIQSTGLILFNAGILLFIQSEAASPTTLSMTSANSISPFNFPESSSVFFVLQFLKHSENPSQ